MTEPIVKRRRGPARPGGGKRKNRDEVWPGYPEEES